jgi:phosphoesterase RecJ-like protein
LLTTHVNPDGDAVGSVLALAHGLRSAGKSVFVALADPPPPYCDFLPGRQWVTSAPPAAAADVAVVCDAGGIDRVGAIEGAVRAAGSIIEIDHHGIARPFGDIRIVDEATAATAELIYILLAEMGIALTPEIATCLMVGVVTDTGAYRYTNVNSRVFILSALLMEQGADMAGIMDQVYDEKPVTSLRLLNRALSNLRCEQGFASATLSLQDFALAGASQTESEGVVGHLRSLKEARAAAVLREAAPGEVRVSLRGRTGYNVALIAAVLGGGGHAAAAGGTSPRPRAAAEAVLREAVYRSLEKPFG